MIRLWIKYLLSLKDVRKRIYLKYLMFWNGYGTIKNMNLVSFYQIYIKNDVIFNIICIIILKKSL
jgi:hypothetical protein